MTAEPPVRQDHILCWLGRVGWGLLAVAVMWGTFGPRLNLPVPVQVGIAAVLTLAAAALIVATRRVARS